MKFPRTIQLDASDAEIYDVTAEPGEWAVSGAFAFLDDDPETLAGKRRQAFASGFLGTRSFGWSTLVAVGEIPDDEFEAVVTRLARHLVEHYGAPDVATAMPAAHEEAQFAASICDHELNTLLAVQREFGEDGVVESFRVVTRPGADDHSRIRLFGPADDDETAP